jgi:hypothetical protein
MRGGCAPRHRSPPSLTTPAARYKQLLQPWTDSQMDYVIAITPQFITGVRLAGWCR